MRHALPPLDFTPGALEPFLSAETLEYHHGRHHRTYVEKLNLLAAGTKLQDLELTELVRRSSGALFDNAAQHFNHSFYWRSIAAGDRRTPQGALRRAIERDFGSLAELKQEFSSAATAHFGSGWCWLVRGPEGRLEVKTTSNAGCPLTEDDTPLLTCDVWEHAYYIDYRNDRAKYVEAFWSSINWDFVDLCFSRPEEIGPEILRLTVPSS